MISSIDALPGRQIAMSVNKKHFVTGNTTIPPYPNIMQEAIFGMGCFWGVERKFWQLAGVYSTAVGYSAGHTPNPSYDELCTGLTGHCEVVKIIFDPKKISYQQLLIVFWESHNPTQGMRQGNDQGSQYRSGIYTLTDEQKEQAIESKKHYQKRLAAAGLGEITTEIEKVSDFFYAEDDHQQYLAKNPNGYCGLGGLNVNFE